MAPLLGAILGALGVLVSLLIVALIIGRKGTRNPQKSDSNSFPRTSTVTDGFDPDVVQSIQRQPPSLDVLPCLQEQACKEGLSLLNHDPQSTSIELHTSSLRGQSYDPLLPDHEDENLQQSEKNCSKKGTSYNLPPSDDSGLSESDTDSDIKGLVSNRHKSTIPKSERSFQKNVAISTEQLYPQRSSAVDHLMDYLTEPFTSSGDSGIHSLSSTKLSNQFSSSEEKARLETSMEMLSQFENSGKYNVSSQSSGEHQVLASLSVTLLGKELISSISSPSSAVCRTAAVDLQHMNHEPTYSFIRCNTNTIENSQSKRKIADFGTLVNVLEVDPKEVLLMRRTLPRSGQHNKIKTNSLLGFKSDEIDNVAPNQYSSSFNLYTSDLPRANLIENRSSNIKDLASTLPHFQSNVNHTFIPHSSSLLNFNKKSVNTIVRAGTRSDSKFSFIYNSSDRESAV